MAIVLVFILGITILVILGFFAVNKWSSPGRDREKSASLRANRQTAGSARESRGTGLN